MTQKNYGIQVFPDISTVKTNLSNLMNDLSKSFNVVARRMQDSNPRSNTIPSKYSLVHKYNILSKGI